MPRGTTITTNSTTEDGRDVSTRALDRGYQWTCPFCGTARVNRVSDEDDEAHAMSALRAHVLSSDDDDHGPAGDYPESFDPHDLAEHVVFRDERRGRG